MLPLHEMSTAVPLTAEITTDSGLSNSWAREYMSIKQHLKKRIEHHVRTIYSTTTNVALTNIRRAAK